MWFSDVMTLKQPRSLVLMLLSHLTFPTHSKAQLTLITIMTQTISPKTDYLREAFRVKKTAQSGPPLCIFRHAWGTSFSDNY